VDDRRHAIAADPNTPDAPAQLGLLTQIDDLANRIDQLTAQAQQTGDARPLVHALQDLHDAVQRYQHAFGAHTLPGADPLDPLTVAARIAQADATTGALNPVDLATIVALGADELGPQFGDYALNHINHITALDPAHPGINDHCPLAFDHSASYDPATGDIHVKLGRPLDAITADVVHELVHSAQPEWTAEEARIRAQHLPPQVIDQKLHHLALRREYQAYCEEQRFLRALLPDGPVPPPDSTDPLPQIPAEDRNLTLTDDLRRYVLDQVNHTWDA
jgi:hypothetical protein